jgi:hypothetical protein
MLHTVGAGGVRPEDRAGLTFIGEFVKRLGVAFVIVALTACQPAQVAAPTSAPTAAATQAATPAITGTAIAPVSPMPLQTREAASPTPTEVVIMPLEVPLGLASDIFGFSEIQREDLPRVIAFLRQQVKPFPPDVPKAVVFNSPGGIEIACATSGCVLSQPGRRAGTVTPV